MMAPNDPRNLKKIFVPQQGQTDCGVACLASILKFYGSERRLEDLRQRSGTSIEGTTLLGLYQAANAIGLAAEAYEADLESLKEQTSPCVLHILVDDVLLHYVTCYGYAGDKFRMLDPAKGFVEYSVEDLEKVWVSKMLLLVEAGEELLRSEAMSENRKKWFKALIKPDLNLLLIAGFLGVAVTLLNLGTAIFSQKLVDDILPRVELYQLSTGVVLLLFLLGVKVGLNYLRQYFLTWQIRDFNGRVVDQFYGKLLGLPKSFFDSRKTGELIARLNDTFRIQTAISFITVNVMIDVFLLIVSMVTIFVYATPIGWLAISYVPAFFALIWFYHKPIVGLQREVMSAFARNESNFVDTIQGVAVIKGGNLQDRYAQQTRSFYDGFQQKIFDLGMLRVRFGSLAELLGSALIVVVVAWSAVLVLEQQLKVGELLALVQLVALLIPAVVRLATTNVQLQEARVAFDRMYEFASIQPEFSAEDDHGKESISSFESMVIRDLSFRFLGRMELLKNLDLEVSKGELVAILGESGSGKSTLLQVIQKFYAFENGEIQVNNLGWEQLSIQSWRENLGIVPQQVKIFNGKLTDNICLANGDEHRESIIAFCELYGFDKFFNAFPYKYDTLIGEEGVNISGGQQQLVALARALYTQPGLLILDEPTAAMDRKTEQFVNDLLIRLKNEMAIIMVTHKVKSASKADRIYILEEGSIAASGTPAELIASDNFYSEGLRELKEVASV